MPLRKGDLVVSLAGTSSRNDADDSAGSATQMDA
jgi:hypothetical protein